MTGPTDGCIEMERATSTPGTQPVLQKTLGTRIMETFKGTMGLDPSRQEFTVILVLCANSRPAVSLIVDRSIRLFLATDQGWRIKKVMRAT